MASDNPYLFQEHEATVKVQLAVAQDLNLFPREMNYILLKECDYLKLFILWGIILQASLLRYYKRIQWFTWAEELNMF